MKPSTTEKNRVASLLACACLAAASATAQTTIFSNNFETDTVGQRPTGFTNFSDNNTTTFVRVNTDSSNFFGAGTSNKMLRLADTVNSASLEARAQGITGGATVATLKFDLYEPSGALNSPIFLHIGNGDLSADATRFTQVQLRDGNLILNTGFPNGGPLEYSLATKVGVTIVANNSLSAVVYAGLDGNSRSLAADTTDVWINNTLSISATAYATHGLANDTVLNSFHFRTFTSDFQEIFIDNVIFAAGAPIPEPASFAALGGLAAIGFAVTRRRRSV